MLDVWRVIVGIGLGLCGARFFVSVFFAARPMWERCLFVGVLCLLAAEVVRLGELIGKPVAASGLPLATVALAFLLLGWVLRYRRGAS